MISKASILCPDGHELVALMKGRNVRRIHATLPMWEIQSTGVLQWLVELIVRSPKVGEPYEERRAAVFQMFLQAGLKNYLACDKGILLSKAGANRSADGAWELSCDDDANAILGELYSESWVMYGRAEPICDGNDVFLDLMRRPEKTIESMTRHDISYVVDAFHDNEPWRVALNPKNATSG